MTVREKGSYPAISEDIASGQNFNKRPRKFSEKAGRIEIREVKNRKQIKAFVRLGFDVYRQSPHWVPPLIRDEINAFCSKKNPALVDSELRLFIAYKEGRAVGRIAALHSSRPPRLGEEHNLRFGWLESIENEEVFLRLFRAVADWALELGMTTISGPYGFFDLDANGILVEGFDQFCTPSGNYNHPYYPRMIERCGLGKEIDYVEYRSTVPRDGIPERLLRLSRKVKDRAAFRIIEFRTRRELLERASELFRLINEAFLEMYGSSPLNPAQVEHYIRRYSPYLDKDLIKIAVNQTNEMVGFIICMPCLSRALQKAHGHLFPIGWYHLLRALHRNEVLEFLLAYVRKSWRGVGVDLLMVIEIVHAAISRGFRFTESNQELEGNAKIQAQWKHFQTVQNKRRRIYRLTLPPKGLLS